MPISSSQPFFDRWEERMPPTTTPWHFPESCSSLAFCSICSQQTILQYLDSSPHLRCQPDPISMGSNLSSLFYFVESLPGLELLVLSLLQCLPNTAVALGCGLPRERDQATQPASQEYLSACFTPSGLLDRKETCHKVYSPGLGVKRTSASHSNKILKHFSINTTSKLLLLLSSTLENGRNFHSVPSQKPGFIFHHHFPLPFSIQPFFMSCQFCYLQISIFSCLPIPTVCSGQYHFL